MISQARRMRTAGRQDADRHPRTRDALTFSQEDAWPRMDAVWPVACLSNALFLRPEGPEPPSAAVAVAAIFRRFRLARAYHLSCQESARAAIKFVASRICLEAVQGSNSSTVPGTLPGRGTCDKGAGWYLSGAGQPQWEEPMELKREIRWRPAFDKRHSDPKKNYGIHGVEMKWLLTGPDGVIQFVVYTNWMLKKIRDERRLCGEFCLNKPLPADIGCHSPIRKYENQQSMGPCEYLDGKDCYYDGSSLNADKGFNILCEKGEEAVWEWMREWYDQNLSVKKEAVAS